MASQDRIDSIFDVASIAAEYDAVKNMVKDSIAQIHAARDKSIDFNVNTKTISDYNAKITELNTSLANMKSTVAATAAATVSNNQAIQQSNGTLAQNIELRKRLKNTLDSYIASQKDDNALLKDGTITRAEYNKRITEGQVKIETYKAKIQELNRVIKEDIALEGRAGDAYKQLSAEYNRAALAAKNYQVTLGAQNPITIAAVKNAKDLSTRLKDIDNAVGQNTRNVGNYSSALSGAFSKIWGGLRTAANIIPGLGIGGLIGGIVGSIGSLAASVASAAKPFKELKEANDALNTSMQQTTYTDTVAEVKTLKTEIQLAKDGFLNKDEVVKHYNETIGKTTGQVNNLNEAEAALNKNAEAYIRFTLLKAAANEVQQRAAKELVEAEIQNQKDLERISKIGTRINRPGDKEGAAISKFIARGEENLRAAEQKAAAKRVSGLENIATKFLTEAAKISKDFNFNFFDQKDEKKKIEKKGRDLVEANRKAQFEILKAQIELDKEYDLIRANDDKKTYIERLSNLINYGADSQRLIEEQAKFDLGNAKLTSTERQKIENDKNNALIRLSTELNEKLKKITQDSFETGTNKLPVSSRIPKELQKILDDFDKAQKKAIKDASDNAKKLKDALREAFTTLSSELQGLFFDIFTNAIERQKNAVQDQIDLLEAQKQKDIEVANQTIANAQERADAISVIEARAAAKRQQLELKQRQLDQQKAKFEKARAIAEIVQSTSLAVANALTQVKTLGPGAIALAAVIGAIGAVQIARALAQPIPRYKDGTDNHPGGLAVVGDGGKSEGVILPDGSTYKTPATDTVVNLPKGSKVVPDYADMRKPAVYVDSVDTTQELRKGFGQVVNAVRRIPQPIIQAEKAWTVAHKQGSNFRTYLNRSI